MRAIFILFNTFSVGVRKDNMLDFCFPVTHALIITCIVTAGCLPATHALIVTCVVTAGCLVVADKRWSAV